MVLQHRQASAILTTRPGVVGVIGDGTLLVVDAANVVGSVPDGWWRDRPGATRRLRDELQRLVGEGLDSEYAGLPAWASGLTEIVLVVEGAARGVASVPGVRIVTALGSGDDAIVELVRVEGVRRRCLVVTADRGLRERVTALGCEVLRPRALRGH